MGEIDIRGSNLGNALTEMLMAEDIQPGDTVSYELCKQIWILHPLGAKMVEAPIRMAQSQKREISVPNSPEERVRDQFVKQWEDDKCDDHIYTVVATARAYGIASLALMSEKLPPAEPIDFKKLADIPISFSVFDPLNTAGSLVLNQNPLAVDFQKVRTIAVSGQPFHRSRAVVVQNERPIYIAYTSSAFGFVGRSVFQRALFPLKSFIQTMITDDLVTKKAGVFIAMLATAGAIVDNIMQRMAGLKRLFVKQATNGNVISIGKDEKIETLNMQNIDKAFGMARQNILENIATAANMPAILLKQETFAEGFGEGTEDAKLVAGFIDTFRREIKPVYDFMDAITMHRAWNKEFFAVMQKEFPDAYGEMSYDEAFYEWSSSFAAEWPSLLTEPESKKVETDDVKLKATIAFVQVFLPILDPANKAKLFGWAQDNVNQNKMMFQTPLQLDLKALADYAEEMKDQQAQQALQGPEEPKPPKPFASTDSARPRRLNGHAKNDVRDLLAGIDPATLRAALDAMARANGGKAAAR